MSKETTMSTHEDRYRRGSDRGPGPGGVGDRWPRRAPARRSPRSTPRSRPARPAGTPTSASTSRSPTPGEPEAAKEVVLNAPEGLFGNPNAIPRCTSSDFALQQCPTASQVGIVTIRANYSGNPNNLLGTAPIYYVQPQEEEETVRFAFIVPALQIPISTPVAVRTASDYGLRFSVSGLTQLIPLAGAKMTDLGLPGRQQPQRRPVRKRLARRPVRLPRASKTPPAQGRTRPAPPITR